MELQFQKKLLPCMREVVSQCREQELTQEVRIPDGMPDIGVVLGTWGQVLVRGKEWRPDSVSVSGGLMVWILYMPEEGDDPQMVETWLPFHSKFDISNVHTDGYIIASGQMQFSDARSISARKFMLRTGLFLNVKAYVSADTVFYTPEQLPKEIQVKKKTYPVKCLSEIGEKTFSLEEPLPIPEGCPVVKKILRYSLQPEILELKVLGGRIVFRGIGHIHILYMQENGKLYSTDVELPFSQYAQLERDYDEGAEAHIYPVVTSLEIEIGENHSLYLKAGLAGQYMIKNLSTIEVVEDAYSTEFSVELQHEQLKIPTILDEQIQVVKAEKGIQTNAQEPVDIEFLPQNTQRYLGASENEVELCGRFHALYYDESGQLSGVNTKWEEQTPVPHEDDVRVSCEISALGTPYSVYRESVVLQSDMQVRLIHMLAEGMEMVSGITLDENAQKKTDRPGIVICRAEGRDLWSIAKETGSTVELIRRANEIDDQVDENRMLLIPVL